MKVIITGASGMVGKGVLLECLDDPRVEEVLLINRSPQGITHAKIREVIHQDFRDFTPISDQLAGYDACFHCMGVSSAGMDEAAYTDITYTMTEALATTLHRLNPGMAFNYVSGAGTDATETSSTMWLSVKGKTENLVLNLGFRDAYAFRPGVILPERGITSRTTLYRVLYLVTRPLFPLLKRMDSVTTTTKLGRAMINVVIHPRSEKRLEGSEINAAALAQTGEMA